jgi:hypothetical protein
MLAQQRPRPPAPTRRPPSPVEFTVYGPPRGARRARRIAVMAALFCLVPVAISLLGVITERSNSSLGIRTVEWMRENGARGIVNQVESIYYSLNAPAKGGPPLHALPAQAGAGRVVASKTAAGKAAAGKAAAGNATAHATPYHPPAIAPVISPALPGEGQWHATFADGAGGSPPLLITSFRPDPNYPRLVAGVAWIDRTRTTTWLYPGIQEPAVSLPSRGPEQVPTTMRSRLVATFNSGFKLQDSGGGVAIGGHTYAPMKRGLATILRHRDGQVDVVSWSGGTQAGPDILYARQNLPLIVSGGRPNPNLSDGPEWGATLGNAIRVWRSGVGVDRHGNLIYAAANDQTVASLAAVLIHAGAVRAMELDINTYWTTFNTYRRAGAVGPARLLADMDRPTTRYLTPDDRDFFAVYVR